MTPKYNRILLKLSGEALMGSDDFGINPEVVTRMAKDVSELVATGIQVGIVIGGGNIFRGAGLAQKGSDRVLADQMGMIATVMNSLAMQDALRIQGVDAVTLSAIKMEQVCDLYVQHRAVRYLNENRVVLMAGGTGNPYFTTDTAASLRAIETGAKLMIKATKVDGVYSADPTTDAKAVFYSYLSYDQILEQGLKVMDATAIVLCRDNKMPLRVVNINQQGALMRLVQDENIGTKIE